MLDRAESDTARLPNYGVVVSLNQEDVLSPKISTVRTASLQHASSGSKLIETVASAFDCPEPFGRNWDALEETLRDLDWFEWESLALRLKDANELHRLPPLDVVILLKVLNNCSHYWKTHGKAFMAVLEGDRKLANLVFQVFSPSKQI